jgi:hypothetical protein
MSNTLKYVLIGLGVIILLLIAAVVISAVFGFGGMNFFQMQPGYRTPFGPFGRMPMMGGRLGFAGWILMAGLACLPPLALILLVALIVGLVTRSRPVPPPPPAAQPPVTQSSVTPTKTCPNCGRPVQEDWTHCPYCGQNLVS